MYRIMILSRKRMGRRSVARRALRHPPVPSLHQAQLDHGLLTDNFYHRHRLSILLIDNFDTRILSWSLPWSLLGKA